MKEKIKKYLIEFKCGTKTMFKEFFNKKTNKKQRANMWTFSRLISTLFITILSILSAILNLPIFLYTAGGVAIAGAITDFFDGRSARKHESYSDYGKKLDQAVDKVFGCGIAINLIAFVNPAYLFLLIGEISIATINILYKSRFKECNDTSSILGKIKQWPFFTSLFLGFFTPLNSMICTITKLMALLTLIMQTATSIDYAQKNAKIVNNLNNNTKKHDNLINNETNYDYEKNNKNITINGNLKEKNNEKILDFKTNSKKEELIKLRNVLLEIKNKKIINENIETKGKQKMIHF